MLIHKSVKIEILANIVITDISTDEEILEIIRETIKYTDNYLILDIKDHEVIES